MEIDKKLRHRHTSLEQSGKRNLDGVGIQHLIDASGN
jgi:hypothetical protein